MAAIARSSSRRPSQQTPAARRRSLVAMLCAVAASCSVTANADPVTIIGGTPVVVQDGAVLIVYLGDPGSLFNNRLYLEAPEPISLQLFDTASSVVGTPRALGPYPGGTALVFADRAVLETNPASYDYEFVTGVGTGNPDGLPHAIFTFDPDDPLAGVTVGFEDLYGGGDFDFDDLQFSLENVGIELRPAVLGGSINPFGSTIDFAFGNETSFGSFGESYENQGTFNNAGSTHLYDGLTNSGTFNNSGDFFADLTSNLTNEFAALLANEAGGTLSFGGGLFGNLGSVFNGGEMSVLLGDLVNSGVFENGIGGAVEILTNASAVNLGQVLNSGTLSNAGSIQNASGGIWADTADAITELLDSGVFDNAGTFNVSGTVSNQGQITTSGAVTVDSTGMLSGAGTFVQTLGDLIVNGSLGGSSVEIQGGTLGGSGTVNAPTTVGPGGAVDPGNSPGTLTIDNAFNLLGGTLNIEIAAPGLFDSLLVTGPGSFTGGTVNFYFGYSPLDGDSFSWLSAGGGLSGWESLTFNYFNVDPALTLETRRLADSLVLSVRQPSVSVPEPASGFLLVIGVALLWMAHRLRSQARPASG